MDGSSVRKSATFPGGALSPRERACYTRPAFDSLPSVPDATLFLPSAPTDDASAPLPRLAALERLMARSAVSRRPCAEPAQWMCEAFGVARQQDWPAAPLALLADGGDPGAGYWLCATPVHMQVRRDQMLMMPPRMLVVAPEESAALVAALAGHFAAEGYEVHAPTATGWYLRCPAPPDLRTTSPDLAAGRPVDPLLPAGRDRLVFHRLMNEAQMLLHEHPVNDAREARGLPAINSLWLWGGGTLPQVATSPWPRVDSTRPLDRGLARLSGVPEGATGARAEPAGLHVTADGLALADLERDGAAPLLEALARGELDRVDIATVAAGEARQWRVRRADLRRFWRREATPAALLGEAR